MPTTPATLTLANQPAGYAFYALIQDVDETLVWNGTNLAADGTPNRVGGRVDLPETPGGSGDYGPAPPPAGLPAGGYSVTYWPRAGASPAVTDPGPVAREPLAVTADPPPDPGADALAVARARSPWPAMVSYRSVRQAGDVLVGLYADGVYPVTVRDQAQSGGVALVGDIRVSLPNPLPGGLGQPKPRDVVTWDGREYTVTETSGRSDVFPGSPFWAVNARNGRVSYDLRETLTLRRFSPAPGAGGVRVAGPGTAVWAGDGRLQIDAADAEPDTAGILATRTRATAFLGGQVLAAAGDVIEQTTGTRWEVAGQATYDQLGLLTTVAVTRLT